MDQIVYEIGKLKRPRNTRTVGLLFRLNNSTFLRNNIFLKSAIRKYFNLPPTTSFDPGFFCSAPLLKVGDNVGLGDTKIIAYAPITIGDNCSFSFGNMIITSTHDTNNFSTVLASPVTIGNNVWITSNVVILPGVTIGDNTIIGAGSIVNKCIPANVLAVGNPCVAVKNINFKK